MSEFILPEEERQRINDALIKKLGKLLGWSE